MYKWFLVIYICIFVYYLYFNCDILIFEWFMDVDFIKYLVYSCVYKIEELYENLFRLCVYCFVVEWDFCFFLLICFLKRVIGIIGLEIFNCIFYFVYSGL